jgi:hypothetical protein
MPEEEDTPSPRRLERWALWITIVSGIFVIVGYFVPWLSLCQWMSLCSSYKYDLAGAKAELSLGQTEDVTVRRQEDNETPAAVQDMECQWRYEPLLPALTSGNRCTVTITNLASYFAGAIPSDIHLEVFVDVWRREGGNTSTVAHLSTTTTLRYIAIPSIDTPADNVLPGYRLHVGVTFPGNGRPAQFACNWTPAERFADAAACATDYIADPTVVTDTTSRIRVDLRGPDGISLGTASKEITVTVPPVHFMLFVIDDTAKVAQPLGNGASLLAAMQHDVLSSVSQPSTGADQFLGLYIFGGPLPPTVAPGSSNPDCARFGSIYRLARFDADRAGQALTGLHPEGSRAPLISALVAALTGYRAYQKQFQVRPNDRFTLTIVTASYDDCDARGAEGFLDTLGQSLNDRELTGIYYDNKLLPIMLRLADPSDAPARAILSTKEYQDGEQPLAILLVPDSAVLAEALAAIAEVSAGDADTRKHGCRQLIGMFDKQGDKAGMARIESRCG